MTFDHSWVIVVNVHWRCILSHFPHDPQQFEDQRISFSKWFLSCPFPCLLLTRSLLDRAVESLLNGGQRAPHVQIAPQEGHFQNSVVPGQRVAWLSGLGLTTTGAAALSPCRVSWSLEPEQSVEMVRSRESQ